MFIIPKKDGRIRWISDLRELNKVAVRHQYPLPIIGDVLRKSSGYKYFTKLDFSMQYYTFELDEASKDLCAIVTPFGKYQYNRLPMGLKCSPDFAQEVMEGIFSDMEDADVYIDDVGIFSNNWDGHVKVLDTVLQRLQQIGFTINPLKCEWGVQETVWLGYWLTPTGLKPWKKKIQAVLDMQLPKNLKQLQGFIGAINYYRDMWKHRSDILTPLSSMTSKQAKWNWDRKCQQAFDSIKKIVSRETLLSYPNFNKPFEIHTDASKLQLGAVISQEGKPIAFYSRKLNPAQVNYTTTERELLSIVETLKEFRNILLGQSIKVYTDHKNLTYKTFNTERVMRWRLILEEYGPELI